ncbi:MAG: hypothetical protein LBB65_00735 [Burkholderiales bacterium]|jgi:hypothetical protein|nr:hypothetical protein [Burkholderiales bacterium]
MKRLFSFGLAAAAFFIAVSAYAQTWTVISLDTIGCYGSGTGFTVNFSGVSVGTWYFDTTVDAAGERYMDEYFIDNNDNLRDWHLYDANDRGLQTQNFPLPAGTPITVTLTLRDATETPVYRTVVELSQCDGGAITGNVSGAMVAVSGTVAFNPVVAGGTPPDLTLTCAPPQAVIAGATPGAWMGMEGASCTLGTTGGTPPTGYSFDGVTFDPSPVVNRATGAFIMPAGGIAGLSATVALKLRAASATAVPALETAGLGLLAVLLGLTVAVRRRA